MNLFILQTGNMENEIVKTTLFFNFTHRKRGIEPFLWLVNCAEEDDRGEYLLVRFPNPHYVVTFKSVGESD